MLRSLALATLAATLALATPALAGQFRINVGGGSSTFAPANYPANPGDYVVWVWLASGHTVTSGDPFSATANGDGKFRSGTGTSTAGTSYSWKVQGSGIVTFYCYPHAPGMRGEIDIQSAPSPIADFRITEVEFAAGGGADRVQIANLGTDAGFLGKYRFSYQAGASITPTPDPITIGAGQRITLHLNAAGTNNSTNVYIPGSPELTTAGSFALYVPNSTTAANGSLQPASLTDSGQMLDYVEWSASGQAAQPNQATAVNAGYWSTGEVFETTSTLPNNGTGYSIVFCGSRTDHGSGFWRLSHPNFGGSPSCTTPTRSPTWGRIKNLYR